MTKEEITKQIRAILDKDPRFKDGKIKIKYLDKSKKES